MIRVPDAPTDARHHHAGTGHHDLPLRGDGQGRADRACADGQLTVGGVVLALRGGCQDSAARACADGQLTVGRVVLPLAVRRDGQGWADRACADGQLTAGPVVLPLALSRHDVTLVGLAPVADWVPPWSDERRLPGREAA